ncbi:hypothetical protein [Roseibium sp.]|uniref:hypothetical protein n=1 Tax=Roseibium sp. TaxID=1936156 RepID=UPI003A98387A
MPEVTGYGSAQVFRPNSGETGAGSTAAKLQEANVRQDEVVAETVKRQAEMSSSRAETLARQAEQIEDRVETQQVRDGIGGRVNVTV